MDEVVTLTYDIATHEKDKPKADISIITDYDQRYLGIISKIFYKDLPSWNDKSGYDLNDILARGGHIAAYWERMRLVGAAVWEQTDDGNWQLLHICLKFKLQRRGHGRIFMDYVIHKIQETSPQGKLTAVVPIKNIIGIKFLEKCGFIQ